MPSGDPARRAGRVFFYPWGNTIPEIVLPWMRIHGRWTMHMADALLSPAVGGVLWAGSSGAIAHCSAKVRKDLDDARCP